MIFRTKTVSLRCRSSIFLTSDLLPDSPISVFERVVNPTTSTKLPSLDNLYFFSLFGVVDAPAPSMNGLLAIDNLLTLKLNKNQPCGADIGTIFNIYILYHVGIIKSSKIFTYLY